MTGNSGQFSGTAATPVSWPRQVQPFRCRAKLETRLWAVIKSVIRGPPARSRRSVGSRGRRGGRSVSRGPSRRRARVSRASRGHGLYHRRHRTRNRPWPRIGTRPRRRRSHTTLRDMCFKCFYSRILVPGFEALDECFVTCMYVDWPLRPGPVQVLKVSADPRDDRGPNG